ncbi:hypothetical protein ACNHT3_004507 [Citrobacter freundii]
MMSYYFSPSKNLFYFGDSKDSYIKTGQWADDCELIDDELVREFTTLAPEGKIRGVVNGKPAWIDISPIPNVELRKAALAALSSTYQDDIEKLNIAWIAAAVNDGVNETAKKDVVLAQINARKDQYSRDRAEIIAQYP